MKRFENPYSTVPDNQMHRTTILAAGHDVAFINSVHGRRGTLQTTLNILLVKLIERLKAHGITSYNPDAYEHALADCTIGIAQDFCGCGVSAQRVEPSEALSGDDGRGTTAVALSVERPADVASDPNGPPKKRVGKRNVKGGKATR